MTTEQINSIIVAKELEKEFFVWQMDPENQSSSDIEELTEAFFNEQTFYEEDEKVFALMEHLGCNWDDAESDYDSQAYSVLTDSEADKALDNRLEEYIDDCVLSNIDQAYHSYFDRDAWKSDNSGYRGEWLNTWNGCEDEETINGTTYYIYKQ